MFEMTYTVQELKIRDEGLSKSQSSPSKSQSSTSKVINGFSIYSEFSKDQLTEIKNVELSRAPISTKVDTLCQHIIWLRTSDPGAKSIIFSQFREFFSLLAFAFEKQRIGFSSMDKAGGLARFKADPSTEVLMLHTRDQAAGLNLQDSASHVFLCEPMLNAALQAQAIARVDRIGQMQETHVWLYLVEGTVEERIHDISIRRRMGRVEEQRMKGKGKGKEDPGAALDEVVGMELQKATLPWLVQGKGGAESVDREDLFGCLFPAKEKFDD